MAEEGTLSEINGSEKQKPYHSASQVCNTLGTVVPIAMANEQANFNNKLKEAVGNVDEYVVRKLHYKNFDDLCWNVSIPCNSEDGLPIKTSRFSREQIDAIASAIYAYENTDNGVIIADETGVGKGRTAAGLLRYAVLELKKQPLFITEKKHLINDIYRDLVDIGFDAGVPELVRVDDKDGGKDFADMDDSDILKIIAKDIKEADELRVDADLEDDFDLKWLIKAPSKKPSDLESDTLKEMPEDNFFEYIETKKDEVIALYRSHIEENGNISISLIPNPDYDKEVRAAIKEGKMVVRPFIFNADLVVKDRCGNVLYEKIPKAEMDRVYKKDEPNASIQDFSVPQKYIICFATYSQFNSIIDKNGFMKNKGRLGVAISKDGVVIMDESHNAAGVNAAGELSNTAHALFRMINNSAMTTYVSATFAKRASSMPLYSKKTSIRESGIEDSDMILAFNEGGNALQEAVATELTKNGQLLRREKQLDFLSEYYYEEENSQIGQNQINKLDRVANLIGLVDSFASSVSNAFSKYKKRVKDMGLDDLAEQEDKVSNVKYAGSIGRLKWIIFNYFLIGLKVNQTADAAIKKLGNGRKTVIAIASTMESAFNNLTKTFRGRGSKDGYEVGDIIKNDFLLYIAYLLEYSTQFWIVKKVVSDNGDINYVRVKESFLNCENKHVAQVAGSFTTEYNRLLSRILESQSTGISISPIDMIQRIIIENGYSIAEITGRQKGLKFDGENTENGTITKRQKKDTTQVIADFNENKIDALIINQSGATGVSMHAIKSGQAQIVDKTPPSQLGDKKKVYARAMVITQLELDVNKAVQVLGRINRTGQVYPPEYTYVISAIPSEAKLAAMMEAKLRSLSSNTSGSQEQSSSLFNYDDFFSQVAVEPFNETLKELRQPSELNAYNSSHILDYTKLLYFRDYSFQSDFYRIFARRLKAEIERLTSLGLYTGKVEMKNYKAEAISEYPFFIGDSSARTSFGGHGIIGSYKVTLQGRKTLANDIKKSIADRLYFVNIDNGEKIFFNSLSQFQSGARRQIEAIRSQMIADDEQVKKVSKERIERMDLEIIEKRKALSEYENIEHAMDVEKSLRDINSQISEKSKSVSDLLANGDMDGVTKVTQEVSQLQTTKTEIQKEYDKYKELLEKKSDYKSAVKDIRDIEEAIEEQEKYRDRQLEYHTIRYSALDRCLTYVDAIGSIVTYETFTETEVAENGWMVFKYSPETINTCVIIGVSVPSRSDSSTLGGIDLTMAAVGDQFQTSLSPLHKEFSEEELADGRQHKERVVITADKYDKNGAWDSYVAKVDSSYKEERYIATGSILKTFILSRRADLNGHIIKFNDADGKIKLGIEIPNQEIPAQSGNWSYDKLRQRYSEGAVMPYPIFFDCNTENFKKYIADYLYYFFVGFIYEAIENKEDVTGGSLFAAAVKSVSSNDNGVVYQIASNRYSTIIKFNPNSAFKANLLNLYELYSHKFNKFTKYTKDEILNNIEIRVISNNLRTINTFAKTLILEYGKTFDKYDYYYVGINPDAQIEDMVGSSDPQVNNNNLDKLPRNTEGGEYYYSLFPSSLRDLNTIKELRYSGILKMSFNELLTCIDSFTEKKSKPILATSSVWFNKIGEKIVIAQDDQIQEVAQDGQSFVDAMGDKERAEFDTLIDELLDII